MNTRWVCHGFKFTSSGNTKKAQNLMNAQKSTHESTNGPINACKSNYVRRNILVTALNYVGERTNRLADERSKSVHDSTKALLNTRKSDREPTEIWQRHESLVNARNNWWTPKSLEMNAWMVRWAHKSLDMKVRNTKSLMKVKKSLDINPRMVW